MYYVNRSVSSIRKVDIVGEFETWEKARKAIIDDYVSGMIDPGGSFICDGDEAEQAISEFESIVPEQFEKHFKSNDQTIDIMDIGEDELSYCVNQVRLLKEEDIFADWFR